MDFRKHWEYLQLTNIFFPFTNVGEQKEKLLLRTDSIFASFLERASLRFTKGEANILEKTTAETQRGQLKQQLLQLQQDYSA